MKLKNIYIKNFRCFDEFSSDPIQDLNIFVGDNNVGKSSIFEAISKLFHSQWLSNTEQAFIETDIRYGDVGSGLNVKCEFLLNDKEPQDLINTIFPNIPSSKVDHIYKFFTPYFSNPMLFFQWKNHPNQKHIKLGPIFIKGGYFSKKIPSGGTTGYPNEFIDLFFEGKSIDEALNVKEVWDSPNIQQIVSQLLLKKFHRFSDFRFRPSNSQRTSELESFQSNETANVLLNLKNHSDSKQRAKYQEICSEFATFFPNLTMDAIETGPASNIADIQVLEVGKNYTAKINQVGSGVAETLTLITNLLEHKS